MSQSTVKARPRATAVRYAVDAFIVLAAGYELWRQLGADYLVVAVLIAILIGVGFDRLIAYFQWRSRPEIRRGEANARLPSTTSTFHVPGLEESPAKSGASLPPPSESKPERRTRPAVLEPRRSGAVCPPGPYEVESGGFQEVRLDLKKGEHMRGRIFSLDGQDFDWDIVDWFGSVNARQGDDYDYVQGEEGVKASAVDLKKNDALDWYLLLRLPRRQNKRSVRIELERV